MPGTDAAARVTNRWVALAVLTVIYGLNLMDRQLLPILSQSIKAEFDLSDTHLGLLSGIVFALFYMSLAVPVARLADRTNRVRIVAAACALWSAFTALSGLSVNAVMLMLARFGVGAGEAGGAAPSYSLIADYFGPKQRALAMAVFNLGFPLGIGAGIALAGLVAAEHGWRAAFLIASAPGLVMAVLLLVVVREPVRGRLDGPAKDTGAKVPLLAGLRAYFSDPVLMRATVATALASIAVLGSLVWIPTYLLRVQGMELSQVGRFFSVTNSVAMAMGLWLGGYLGQRLARRRGERGNAMACLFGTLAAGPCLAFALLSPSWPVALAALILPTAFGFVFLGPATAIAQNAAPPEQRSFYAAVFMFCSNVAGQGGGPLLVGMISDALTPRFGPSGLTWALIALAPIYLLATLAYLWTARAISRRASDDAGLGEAQQHASPR